MPSYDEYREALKITSGVYVEAANLLGVRRQTVREFVERHATLKKEVKEYHEILLDYTEKGLIDGVKRNDLECMKLVLKYYGHKRKLVPRRELTGKDGEDLMDKSGTQIDAKIAMLLHQPEFEKFIEILEESDVKLIGLPDSEPDSESS